MIPRDAHESSHHPGRDPTDEGAPAVVEVPVVPVDQAPGDAGARSDDLAATTTSTLWRTPSRPTLRTAIAVSAGLVAAIVLASVAVQIWSDERRGESGDGAPVDDAPLAALVVPETLPPLPTPTRSAVADPLANRPPLDLRLLNAPVEADLAVGVARLEVLDDSADQMSETFVEAGADGFAMSLRMARDGATDVIAATIETPGLVERVIVDERAGVGYVQRGVSSWETFDATKDVVAFWRGLLAGPLTPDLVADATRSTVISGPVVAVEGPPGTPTTPARAFRVGAEAREFAEWIPFALGPIEGAEAITPTTLIDLIALVTPDDRLVEVRWTVPFGTGSQLVVHRPSSVVDVEIDVEIEVPPPSQVTGAATDWIVLPR